MKDGIGAADSLACVRDTRSFVFFHGEAGSVLEESLEDGKAGETQQRRPIAKSCIACCCIWTHVYDACDICVLFVERDICTYMYYECSAVCARS